jgi:hypothetical protein
MTKLLRTRGGYFIQGKRVTSAEVRARVGEIGSANDSRLPDDEAYLFIPANILDRINKTG